MPPLECADMDESHTTFQAGGIVIRFTSGEVCIQGRQISLSATESRLLQFLTSRAGAVSTRKEIIEAVHGADYPATDRSVDVQIVGLRKKLGDLRYLIEAVRGSGYRLRLDALRGTVT
jgi:two-component system, OmpR family, alkaline phosphatase synthesis response regulator PhoP